MNPDNAISTTSHLITSLSSNFYSTWSFLLTYLSVSCNLTGMALPSPLTFISPLINMSPLQSPGPCLVVLLHPHPIQALGTIFFNNNSKEVQVGSEVGNHRLSARSK